MLTTLSGPKRGILSRVRAFESPSPTKLANFQSLLSSGEEDVARVARGVQREAQLERGVRLQGARRHARHDRQRAGHRRRAAGAAKEEMPRLLMLALNYRSWFLTNTLDCTE